MWDGMLRGDPEFFSTAAAIIFLIAYKTAEPVSCDDQGKKGEVMLPDMTPLLAPL